MEATAGGAAEGEMISGSAIFFAQTMTFISMMGDTGIGTGDGMAASTTSVLMTTAGDEDAGRLAQPLCIPTATETGRRLLVQPRTKE